MINKQSVLFLVLISSIMILSVYYITMPNDLVLSNNETIVTNYTESDIISVLKSSENESKLKIINELNEKLLNSELSSSEKNDIYNEIKSIRNTEVLENNIEKTIKDNYNLNSFVKLNDDNLSVTINSKVHDNGLVVNLLDCIENSIDNDMFISINFKE